MHDPTFFDRVLGTRSGTTRRQMFGCVVYFHEGRLAAVFDEGRFVLRLAPDVQVALFARGLAKPWSPMGGTAMSEYALLSDTLVRQGRDLDRLVEKALAFAATRPLPKKRSKKAKA